MPQSMAIWLIVLWILCSITIYSMDYVKSKVVACLLGTVLSPLVLLAACIIIITVLSAFGIHGK